MNRYLPAGMRCTAYWYAHAAGMLTGADDPEFLRELGLVAWQLAQARGIPVQQVPEGPYLVHTWPEEAWDAASAILAEAAERYGDWHVSGLQRASQAVSGPSEGSWDPGWPPMGS